MLHFQPLLLQDAAVLRPYFQKQTSRICDSTVGGTFLWRDYFQTAYAEADGSLFLRSQMPDTGEVIYSVPMEGDVPRALRTLEAHCRAEGTPLTLSTVPAEELPVIRALWPGARVTSIPEWADYLYNAEDLCQLRGKKYASQRNQISQFVRRFPDWSFVPVTADDLEPVRDFYRWFVQVNDKDSETFREDEFKVAEVLQNFALYDFTGGAVVAGGRVIAMALGEVVGDTLYVHIEKADASCHGAYQMIVREFSRYACRDGVNFINREDDAGDEGLRQSKEKWRPCALLDKYLVKVE